MLNSVKKTIGVPHESIIFDNREAKYGLCKVYNICAQQANGAYLCFIHEDVIMTTHGWGAAMTEFTAQTPDCGVIGFMGGLYVSQFVGTLWNIKNGRHNFYHFENGTVDAYLKNNKNVKWEKFVKNPYNELFSRVLTLDGVFLFASKKVWEHCPFDERYTHFHYYDADFSFTAAQHYKNYVYFGADIYHISGGNREWNSCAAMLDFQKKWRNVLPMSLVKMGRLRTLCKEFGNVPHSYRLCRRNGFTRKQLFDHICSVNRWWFAVVAFAAALPAMYLYWFIKKI